MMNEKTCGNCKHYISGLHVLGSLFRGGSVCQNETVEAFQLLRARGDKPFDPSCWERIEEHREARLWD